MSDYVLTIREVAELLKINEKTVYKLAAESKIPGFKVGGSWRFDRSTIAKWIERKSANEAGADQASGLPEPEAVQPQFDTSAAASYSPHQGTFFAHRLTLEGTGEDALAQSLSTARVDMNPHQVDAALFALASPLSKGVLLADEVGLGKTIEASLVIAQRWAERRRRILLIVPASLRKQWSQELHDKFSLPSTIIESKTYNEARKAGVTRPFDRDDSIVVTSYEFAALKADDIARGNWDLVVFDEAHRLRNVYKKDGSVRAKRLRDATRSFFKILLTATPLQNSLMELYGLVSMLDEKHFGDEYSFRTQYVVGPNARNGVLFLRKRLESICKRTLRRQVQQAGLIRYTERCPLTLQFEPSQDEMHLYTAVSAYLQRKDTVAFGDKPNQLVTLVVRKILGSSTFAVCETLSRIIERLKHMQRPSAETVADYDVVEETAEEFDSDDEETETPAVPIDPKRLEAEIAELEGYRNLALRIGQNAKGLTLVNALPGVLEQIVTKGGQRKAVIFTESVRTQRYLAELLAARGFENDIALLNGQNNDAESKAIYQDWLARHKGTDAVSGSKSADMKAAIVEAFRERKTILIATESGGEGINLQFCSLLINFDLPWNPQRVEQRIGRCHRYGQKIDVTVVNFLNLKNHAERRVHQLLDEKFNLFKGVFGASDEVLGVIERGVDIERRILEIVQGARTEAEIDESFDKLQDDLQAQISEQVLDARKRLLEAMDERVIDRLKTRDVEIGQRLSDFERQLVLVARAELPDARFHDGDERRFDYKGETYTTEWPLADEHGWKFFRLFEGTLATSVTTKAKARQFDAPGFLRFDPRGYKGGRLTDVEHLRGKSGWMRISKLKITTPAVTREHLVISIRADDGTKIHPETVERLMRVPATNEALTDTPPEADLLALEDTHRKELLSDAEQQNAEWLDVESEKLDAYADDLERAFESEVKTLEAEIREAKKNLRGSTFPMAEKVAEKRRIGALETKRDKMKAEFFDRRATIRADVDAMLDHIQESLKIEPAIAALFTIRWEVA
jgi:excisionase family DNA binding protein